MNSIKPFPANFKPPADALHGRRQDIQGLRGVAVLLVVLFHAGLPIIPGGFVGVDIFFVISGFLITQLLLNDIERSGRVDFARFFARRAKRLLPAALILLIGVMTVSCWLYPPAEQQEWQSAARAAALYLSNFWLAGRSLDYFESSAHANPLLHTWSLAVEEQFYMVWPILLWILMGRATEVAADRRSALAIKVALISLVSLAACVWLTDLAQPWAFFGMPLRAWEFGLGALVALKRLDARKRNFAWVASWSGFAAILASSTLFHEGQAFPGLSAALPAGGTALLLLGLEVSLRKDLVARLLSTWPLVVMGDVSYSWYLWHWPMLVWAEVLWPTPSVGQVTVIVCGSFLLAVLSLRLVENPIRRASLTGWSNWLVIGLALGSSVLVAGLAWLLMQLPVPANQVSIQKQYSRAATDKEKLYSQVCLSSMSATEVVPCTFGRTNPEKIVILFGDSHAAHFIPAFKVLALKHGWQLVTVTKSACPALDMTTYNEKLQRNYRECDVWRESALIKIAELKPQLVVLINSGGYRADTKERAAALTRTLDRLSRLSLHQVVIRDSPWPGFNVPVCLGRASWLGRDATRTCTFSKDAEGVWHSLQAEADRVAASAKVSTHYLDLSNAFCTAHPCEVQRGTSIMFSDANHLTFDFSEALAPALESALGDALGKWHQLLSNDGPERETR